MAPNLFASYPLSARERATSIIRAMEGLDIKIWDPAERIPPSETWSDTINRAIGGSDACVFFLTEPIGSAVALEAGMALGLNKPIVAVRLDDTSAIDDFTHATFGDLVMVDAVEQPDDAVAVNVAATVRRLGRPQA